MFVKTISIKTFLIILFCVATNVAYAQYTIPNKTKAKVELDLVTAPHLKSDTTKLKTNTKAYYSYLKRKERMDKNSFVFTNSLNTSQTGYKNWSGGGVNSILISIRSILDHTYNSNDKNFSTRTTWDLRYGIITKEFLDKDKVEQKKFAKNEDKVLITNNINYKLHGKFYYDFNTSLSTQFSDTYANILDSLPSSKFFSPATLNIGLGFTYKLDANRTLTFSPISGNMLFVNNDILSNAGAFGIEKGKHLKSNIGINFKVNWVQPIIKNKKTGTTLSYKIIAESFYDYKSTPSLNWDNTLNLRVFKYITLNFNWTLKFDSKIIPQEGSSSFWQFRDILSVGVTYVFNNKTRKIRRF